MARSFSFKRGKAASSAGLLEALEPRLLLSAAYPTTYETYLLELVNWTRANPTVAANLYLGGNLNEGLPAGTISSTAKQPLAFNPYLVDAAQKHTQWMIDTNTFSHTGLNNSDPGTRMASAGYATYGTFNWGENLGWGENSGDLLSSMEAVQQHLFTDESSSTRAHRVAMLTDHYKEAGTGVRTGTFQSYSAVVVTEDFADIPSQSGGYLTGVAYNDAMVRPDDFYTPGEGLAGLSVKAIRQSDGQVFSTTTWDAGGYTLWLAPGTYDITCSGTGITGAVIYRNVVMGTTNVKEDFRPDYATPQADLQISGGTYTSGAYVVGKAFGATANVFNAGADASAFSTQVRLSRDLVWGNGDDIVVSTQTTSAGLASLRTGQVGGSGAIGSATSGMYYVAIFADSASAVPEGSESNNVWWSSTPNVWVLNPGGFFNEAEYLAMYGDVRAAVTGGTLSSGYQHFVSYGLLEGRNPSAFFDSGYYLASNGDVSAAIGSQVFASAFEHYLLFGRHEGRNPSRLYSESYYLSANPDVASAVSGGAFQSGLEHFTQFGATEGRYAVYNQQLATAQGGWAHPLFDESYYLAYNTDVAAAVAGGTFSSGFEHFVLYGQYEGRRSSFDENQYRTLYPDVAAAVTAGYFSSGLDHYIRYGRAEGRQSCPLFVESAYLAKYPDVAAAVKAHAFASGFEHYVLYGQYEGRSSR